MVLSICRESEGCSITQLNDCGFRCMCHLSDSQDIIVLTCVSSNDNDSILHLKGLELLMAENLTDWENIACC